MEELMKVEDPIIKDTLYDIWTNPDGKEEVKFAGYDMGNRVYIVKHLDDKHFICKVPACRVLCGARGCGMVFPFGTKYYLARISNAKIPEGWNSWTGKLSLTHEISGGRKWKEVIAILEEIWKGETAWIISFDGEEHFFLGNEDDAERERYRQERWYPEKVATKRLATEEEIKENNK